MASISKERIFEARKDAEEDGNRFAISIKHEPVRPSCHKEPVSPKPHRLSGDPDSSMDKPKMLRC